MRLTKRLKKKHRKWLHEREARRESEMRRRDSGTMSSLIIGTTKYTPIQSNAGNDNSAPKTSSNGDIRDHGLWFHYVPSRLYFPSAEFTREEVGAIAPTLRSTSRGDVKIDYRGAQRDIYIDPEGFVKLAESDGSLR